MPYIDDAATLSEEITSLDLEVATVDAGNAESSTPRLFVNVVFTDGTRLYEPFNHRIQATFPTALLPPGGEAKTFSLPLPPNINRTLGEIAELFLRKPGSDGWLMESAKLFANDEALPVIGNEHANQFLDNNDDVLELREWSTASLCVAPVIEEKHPLPRSGYRTLGPVLGQASENEAVVLYRVDREGAYHFRATDAVTGAVVLDQETEFEPTGRFELSGLQAERSYDFELSFVRAGVETPVPDGAGSLQTYPADGTPGTFSFAFGSCANPDETVAQGAWTGIRSLAMSPPPGIEPVRLFVHLGDTFYFYDNMTDETVANKESMHAAHVSQRRHIEFLDMAEVVPSCAVWDDHDFARNNSDSTDISSTLKLEAKDTWLEYWGNNQPISSAKELGISTRISHGLVDIYLLDGRFNRDKDAGVCFGEDLIEELLRSIRIRGASAPRAVVLATGSSWNHMLKDSAEKYGHENYDEEREDLYSQLSVFMGEHINGLILLSGETHINEIYHVELGNGKMAPEFSSSPLTRNTPLEDARDLEDERVASFGTSGDEGKRGFATLTIDTTDPDGNWSAIVRYYQEAAGAQHQSRSYTVSNGEFVPA